MRKTSIERRKISLLNDIIRTWFVRKVIKLVDVVDKSLWVHFKDGFDRACDEVFGKRGSRISKGCTLWQNEEVKEAIS